MSSWNRCAVDSGMVAMAIGMIANTAAQLGTGSVKCGTDITLPANTPEKLTSPSGMLTIYPTIIPKSIGS
ncbi:hypothetical protein SDC9_196612 [bioreactor metagenome]|uniref:Uncharacterized protein n=1 Tax=bioreactor metagenome TaxID=1076179 RepID=A0A645IEU8_9ZZZZ